MKTLIVTVAGTATRFNRDTDEPTLKCLYNIGGALNSLLYHILDKARDFDEFVIVGGYLLDKLKSFIDAELTEFRDRIRLVENPEYSTLGSGYSLILGIRNMDPQTTEVVFVEGDLYFNREDFDKVKRSERSVFTVNHELITSKKAVVVYKSCGGTLRYLYDTSHRYLEIREPFLAVYNSGQVWKFTDPARLVSVTDGLTPDQMAGTNLEIIQGYFGSLPEDDYEMVAFSEWYNCNTVADYKSIFKDS